MVFTAILFAIFLTPRAAVFAQALQFPNVPCVPDNFTGPLAPGQTSCGKTLKILGIDLGCFPHLPPNDSQGNGCGLDDFVKLLRRVINYLTVIVLPLVAAMVVWGGLAIMTAAGSVERISKGKQIIWTAVIGAAIVLGAWLIINTIYLALTGKGV